MLRPSEMSVSASGGCAGAGCRCRPAVERAYRELRVRGLTDAAAFAAAVTVYRHHHPEAGPWQAGTAIADWLDPASAPLAARLDKGQASP
jgi:hypothetical protein